MTDDTAAPRLLPSPPWALLGPSRFLVSVSPLPPARPKVVMPPTYREINLAPPGAKLHDRVCSCRLKPCVCAASRWENVVVVVALLLEKVEVAREEA